MARGASARREGIVGRVPSPSPDPVAELADLQKRFALALAARDDLIEQCRGMLALVERQQRQIHDLQRRIHELETKG
jgi:hypothetical protein